MNYSETQIVCLVAQSCLSLCDPMDCSPPGSSVHGILQARRLEQVAMPSSRGFSQPRDQTQVSRVSGGFFSMWATREAQEYWSGQPIPSPEDPPNPGIEPRSPALQADSLPAELPGKWNLIDGKVIFRSFCLRFCYCLVTKSCLTLCDPMWPAKLLCPWDSPGRNTGVGCHFLLQEIFPTQGSNLSLLHWHVDSSPLTYLGRPNDPG